MNAALSAPRPHPSDFEVVEREFTFIASTIVMDSIRAPARGRPWADGALSWQTKVSIRAPARGATRYSI